MAMLVNLHDAEGDLSRLVSEVLAGEEVIIARDGKPVARLVQIRPDRVPGTARGMVQISDAFGSPLPDDVIKTFEST